MSSPKTYDVLAQEFGVSGRTIKRDGKYAEAIARLRTFEFMTPAILNKMTRKQVIATLDSDEEHIQWDYDKKCRIPHKSEQEKNVEKNITVYSNKKAVQKLLKYFNSVDPTGEAVKEEMNALTQIREALMEANIYN